MMGFYAAGAMGGGVAPPGFAVQGVTQGTMETPGTTYNFTLPATVNNGDLLILFVCACRASSTTTVATPSGWTEFYNSNAGSIRMKFLYRYAGSGEGGGSISLVAGHASSFAVQCWRVSGAAGAPAFAAASSGGWGTVPNPPALVSGFAGNILWLTGGSGIPNMSVSAWPAGFSDNPTITGVSGTIPQVLFAASMFSISATVNPAVITTSANFSGAPFTMAIASA